MVYSVLLRVFREGKALWGFSMDSSSGGLRILIIEDSPVVAIATEEMLRDLGHTALGPAGNMASALELGENEEMDAAIVDLNIRGTKAFSLLKILEARGIPFLLASGYADWSMPNEWADRPRLQKPFSASQLRAKLNELFTASA